MDPNTSASSRSGAGKTILLGVGAFVVLALVVVALVAVLGGGDDSAGAGELLTAPTELDELWSTDVNGEFGFASLGDSAVYVAAEDGDDTAITSLTSEDGDENWESRIDGSDFVGLVGEFGDVAVFNSCRFDTETTCLVVALGIADGEEIWREPIGEGGGFERSNSLLVQDGEGLQKLDPATGDRIERIRGAVVFGDSATFDGSTAWLLDDDGEVSAYDDDLQPLLGPIEVDGEYGALAYDGERLIVAVDDELRYGDDSGDLSPGPFLDGDITRLIAVDRSTIVAELGDEVVVYDIDGEDAVERWAQDGTLLDVEDPDGGAVVIVEDSGERLVFELESGDDRFDFDADEDAFVPTTATRNALVVEDQGSFTDLGNDTTVTAYDWLTGEEIWSEDFEGTVRVGEVVVVVEADGSVTAYG